MSLGSQLVRRALKLAPSSSRSVRVHRDLRVPMPDGTVLLADRWAPGAHDASLPTALYRTPYGRGGIFGLLLGRVMAERGFQVVIQSARGTSGSGGTFDPMRQEREDGLATLDWVVKQPWFGDSLVLLGGSYLGYTQWAVADRLPPQVKAMVPASTDSALQLEFLRKDGLSLQVPFTWGVVMMDGLRHRGGLLHGLVSSQRKARAVRTLPLGQADVAATGHRVDYVRDLLTHDATSPRWHGIDHSHRVAGVTVPVSAVGGWYDLFLPGQLRDFRSMQVAGRPARLMVGPWTHTGIGSLSASTRESIDFGLAHARGEQPPPRAPVRLYVMGEEAWREFDSWPPEGYPPQQFYLQPDQQLSTEIPPACEPDHYRYDPADPTPAVGGVTMQMRRNGRVENSKLEARPDVLTYTTAALDRAVEVIGEVSAQIWFQSSLRYADVFVRLCDVTPRGRSHNVCDGLLSLTNATDAARATVRMWPTAYRFKRGHRIRIQVSSGAFPRYARNTGTGESHASAATLITAAQSVYHDPERPSAVILPMRRR